MRFVVLIAGVLWSAGLSGQTEDERSAKSRQAKELMTDERFVEAIPIYRELLKSRADDPEARLGLAKALRMAGRPGEAVAEFEAAVKAEPENAEAWMGLGASYLASGKADRSVAPLEKAVGLRPKDLGATALLGNALFAVDRPGEAAAQFRKVTEAAAGDAKAWFGLGRCYESLAAKAFAEVAKDSAEWLVLTGSARLARGQYRAAFYFYRQALGKNGKLAGVHGGLAEVYRGTGHPDWAAVEEKREAETGAGEKESAFGRTRMYSALAADAFGKLAKLPETVETHSLLADVAAGRGQFLEAAKEWRAAIRVDPADGRLEGELASALFQGRDYAGALPLLVRLVKRDPGSADWNYYLGDSYLRLDQAAKALEYLEEAVKLDSSQLAARASLGLTLVKLGRARDAVGHLEAGVDSDEDGSIHLALGRAYEAAGELAKAKAMTAEGQRILAASEAARDDLEETVKITEP